jgi:hypothetical protein
MMMMMKEGVKVRTDEVSTLDETVIEFLAVGPVATEDFPKEDELAQAEGCDLHGGIPEDMRVAVEAEPRVLVAGCSVEGWLVVSASVNAMRLHCQPAECPLHECTADDTHREFHFGAK